ncbi:MAG: restriction endonuclease subunit S [Alphaproteobacteria bacterium]|nr:restriction endonuclease subunit S [Alphaproteobacteria bacterium]
MKPYLQVISYTDLSSWGYGLLSYENCHAFKYPMLKIGQVVKEYIEKAFLEDNELYTRVKIRINNNGVVKRDVLLGKDIKTKGQYYVKKGQFIFSHIDARNGAFGIVPDDLDGAIITNSFAAFDCDEEKINPLYLNLLVCTDYFKKIWLSLSVGTTNRRSVSTDKFLDVKIPVPSLSEQAEILSVYNSKMAEANAMQYEHSYNEIENEIEKYLQLQAYTNIDSNEKLSFINYSDCLTWDVRNKQQRVFISSKYKQQTLSKVVRINPTIRKNILDEEDVSFIPMECVSDLDGEVKEKRTCKASAKGFTKFEEGDIIWAKITPCMQNGKSAIVRGLTNGIGYGSTEFYVIRVNETVVLPEYVYYLLRMYRVRETAVNHFSGSAGQQRVRKSFLEELSIPVPSLEEQEVMVATLNNIKSKIIANRTRVEELICQAKQDFENAIFGGK